MTARRVAAVITNYNMPEKCDALCEHILTHTAYPVTLFVVDNASDLVAPSHFTNVKLEKNVQTTGGWLAGLKAARQQGEWLAYWFLITSAEFTIADDPLTPLVGILNRYPDAVGVHPALTNDSTTAWEHLKDRGTGKPRRTWMIDNIASLYRADWFDSIGGFRPALTMGWGIDLETCWIARQQGRALYVQEVNTIKKTTDIGYTMNRMNMTARDRRIRASTQMRQVLRLEYGPNWWERMNNENVDPSWR